MTCTSAFIVVGSSNPSSILVDVEAQCRCAGGRRRRTRAMTKNRLLISNDGEIECELHTPYKGSDCWYTGQWRTMRVDERAELTMETGREPACETCMAIARNATAVKS